MKSTEHAGLGLKDKQIVVTGASEGIGLAIVQSLNREGARVLMVSRSLEKLERAKGTLTHPELVTFVAADRGDFLSFDEKRVLNQLNLNVVAAMEITKNLFEPLKRSRGSIVNISSVAGRTALPERLWYGVAKSALDFATKALASEWGKYGIRVNGVAPWFIRTELTRPVLEEPKFKARLESVTPLGRLGETKDIANCALFLLSPLSSYITGQTIAVDGGFTTRSGL